MTNVVIKFPCNTAINSICIMCVGLTPRIRLCRPGCKGICFAHADLGASRGLSQEPLGAVEDVPLTEGDGFRGIFSTIPCAVTLC